MAFHNVIGKRGEDVACAFLKREGFRVLERNLRTKWSELDIVCRNKRKELVFVEVKSRGVDDVGIPEEALTADKRRRLARAAAAYAVHVHYTGLYHINAVCVVFAPNGWDALRITRYDDLFT